MRKEYWRPVVGYEKLYEVSDWGRVASLNYRHTGKRHLLTPRPNRNGYLRAELWKDGKRTRAMVHLLVWDAFVGEDRRGLEVNHIDEDKNNCAVWNLNLLTRKQNNDWGTRTERAAKARINHPAMSKAVVAKNPVTLKVVYEFPSTMEAGRNGFSQGNVSYACNGCYLRDGNHTYKGLDWYWA